MFVQGRGQKYGQNLWGTKLTKSEQNKEEKCITLLYPNYQKVLHIFTYLTNNLQNSKKKDEQRATNKKKKLEKGRGGGGLQF